MLQINVPVKKANWKYKLTSLIFILVLLLNFNCKLKNRKIKEIRFKNSKNVFSRWNEIFCEHQIITLDSEDSEILSIGDMVISPLGDYFIFDGRSRRVMHFDYYGNFLRSIGKLGEGPGEFFIASCPFLDKENNLYIYDVGKNRLNKYTFPNYKFEKQIKLKEPTAIQDLTMDNNGNFIIYTLNSPKKKILFKLDQNGSVIRKSFTPKKEKLRLFLARFQLGRFSEVDENGFLFIYPEAYKIYFFNYDFALKRVLYAEESSKYYPFIEKLPNDLSPFSMTPRHMKWWSKSLHPAFIYYLGKHFFIVVLFEYNNTNEKSYINLHDLDGLTYAKGVEVPYDGIIRYAQNGLIYIVEESTFNEDGEILPLKLHRFKLRMIH